MRATRRHLAGSGHLLQVHGTMLLGTHELQNDINMDSKGSDARHELLCTARLTLNFRLSRHRHRVQRHEAKTGIKVSEIFGRRFVIWVNQ